MTSVIDPRPMLEELGLAGVRQVSPVPGGSDTTIFRVAATSGVYAVRIFRPDQHQAARREAAASAAAAAGGIPAARVLAVSAVGRRPVMLLEWVDGMSMLDRLGHDPDRVRELGRLGGEVQARLHTIAAPHLPGLEGRALRSRLPAAPDGARLLHLDLHPGNVLVRDSAVVAVIDWANARSGPALADVARTYSILAWDPTVPRSLTPLRRELWRGWREGYESVAGPLTRLAPFVAWAAGMMVADLRHRLSPDQVHDLEARARRWNARTGG